MVQKILASGVLVVALLVSATPALAWGGISVSSSAAASSASASAGGGGGSSGRQGGFSIINIFKPVNNVNVVQNNNQQIWLTNTNTNNNNNQQQQWMYPSQPPSNCYYAEC